VVYGYRATGEPCSGGSSLPPSIRALKPITDGIVPITLDERRARIEQARRLMAENRLDAIMVEAGTSLFYSPASAGARASGPKVSAS